MSEKVTTIKQWQEERSFQESLRDSLRNFVVSGLSIVRRIPKSAQQIRFPYYHHVFDDERAGFARQLAYLKNFGDFISVDDALDLMASPGKLNGQYFCVTFDDGFKNCLTNALPILVDEGVPALFYIATSFVGRRLDAGHPEAAAVFGFRCQTASLDFLDWDDCRTLTENGLQIGSHSVSHPTFTGLRPQEMLYQLADSRREIEVRIGRACDHFCIPYGMPLSSSSYPALIDAAQSVGYRSIATGIRGANSAGQNPFELRRDHLLANWSNPQLRYFFAQP